MLIQYVDVRNNMQNVVILLRAYYEAHELYFTVYAHFRVYENIFFSICRSELHSLLK